MLTNARTITHFNLHTCLDLGFSGLALMFLAILMPTTIKLKYLTFGVSNNGVKKFYKGRKSIEML